MTISLNKNPIPRQHFMTTRGINYSTTVCVFHAPLVAPINTHDNTWSFNFYLISVFIARFFFCHLIVLKMIS